ncbi:YecA family protein [Vibrio metschnikovii]|uniref:YecA family protein n=2 Tax=Vibrio metschnikovii TaxID=28172 RepID=A0A9X0RBT4_VIBME|nr:YecA family protein [Vibrio metschnikovii]MBC3618649.1 YecA family protein [Vibrio metschnikovii]MBC5814661.1 YecA family protein [Vibrio metschnikovii]MBC5852263.1 YecA family protein [Vibrio metschnikovii]
MTLNDILSAADLEDKLLNEAKTQGFITAMALAPNVLPPSEWLPFLWGGDDTAPFSDAKQMESYFGLIIRLWNEYRPALLDGSWTWPEGCELDEEDIVTQNTRDFCEGVLQGWQLTRDDWEVLMPENSQENALMGGVLLSLSMLYDPETSLATLAEQGMNDLDQFTEIYNAIPVMLCGLTQRAVDLAESDSQ